MKKTLLIATLLSMTVGMAHAYDDSFPFGFRGKWENEYAQGYSNYWGGEPMRNRAIQLVCLDGKAQYAELSVYMGNSTKNFKINIDGKIYDNFQVKGKPNGANWTEMIVALSKAKSIWAITKNDKFFIPTKNQGILKDAIKECRP